MKKIFYLPALIAAIAMAALCSSCGDGVHPPAKKPTPKKPDTTNTPTPSAKKDTATQK